MSSAAASTPLTYISPKDGASPSQGAEPKDEEVWSGEDDDGDGEGEGDGDGGEQPRAKRRKTNRPMSVSCELCKQRKARNRSQYVLRSSAYRK